MKKLFRISCMVLFVLSVFNASAQTYNLNFKEIGKYIKSLGSLDSMNVGTISSILSKKYHDKIDKAYAFYYWIANNITYDVKAARANSTSKNSPVEVLFYRKAVGIGFASLFQDMCSNANIRCLTVDGYIKNNVEDIGEKGKEINHSWAVVQLGDSPDTWYYVDPAMGSGLTDAEMKTFTPAYTDAYFFTDKETFNLQHYPDNTAWKLGNGPKSKKAFFDLPVIKHNAIELGTLKILPDEGFLKVKANKPVDFTITLNKNYAVAISKVEIGVGVRKKYKTKPVEYTFNKGLLSFSYTFEEEDSYPISILVNGKPFAMYQVDIK